MVYDSLLLVAKWNHVMVDYQDIYHCNTMMALTGLPHNYVKAIHSHTQCPGNTALRAKYILPQKTYIPG